MLWERNKGSEHTHPIDLGFGKRFEVICNDDFVANTKTQRRVLWNSAITTIFGYSFSAALNRLRIADLAPERFKGQHQAAMACHQKRGRGRYIDVNGLMLLPTMAKTGKEIRVELFLSAIAPEDDHGGPYVLAIARDVIEQNRAEELDAQLLGHLSREELISDLDTTLLLDVTSEPTYRSRKCKM